MRATRVTTCIFAVFVLSGCEGVQHVLAPAGTDARALANLFWIMLAGAVVLWLLLNGLMLYVSRLNREAMSPKLAEGIIIGGGIAFPTVVLAVLLSYGLAAMPDMREIGTADTRLRVTGEQFWWRVEYWPEGSDTPIRTANEIVLPVGQRTEIALLADQVIHSFWIPALGGKTDMIPGTENRMSLEPDEIGEYRGQCTEFCGESHAWMAFGARVLSEQDFAAWLEHEASDALPPETGAQVAGQAVFLAEGCGACHAVRGTPASGLVGPDLTHVGSRMTLAAGALPMTQEALVRWIRAPEGVKPGAKMPGYDHLTDTELTQLAAYLEQLK